MGPLLGGNNYRQHLFANISAKLFCNVTLPKAGPELRWKHGPLLVYFGLNAPEGKPDNWLKTVPGKGYFVVLRLYFPTEAGIDRSWKPGDFELLK